MLGLLQKAIHIIYALEPSQSNGILFPNLQYVCTFLEVARPYWVPLELLVLFRFLKDWSRTIRDDGQDDEQVSSGSCDRSSELAGR